MSNGAHVTVPAAGLNPIDMDQLLERLDGDTELLMELAAESISESGALLAELRPAVSAGDIDHVAKLAHTLKGMYGTLAAGEAAGAAATLERAARDGRASEFAAGLVKLEQETSALCAALRELTLGAAA